MGSLNRKSATYEPNLVMRTKEKIQEGDEVKTKIRKVDDLEYPLFLSSLRVDQGNSELGDMLLLARYPGRRRCVICHLCNTTNLLLN